MNSFDLRKYLDIAIRRIYWIIIPFLVVVLGGLGFVLAAPKMYEAKTLILVQPQKVPEEFVREIVSTDVDARLKTIGQQVTSRTNLEKIISEYGLFTDAGKNFDIDSKVELLRKRINIEVSRGGPGRGSVASAFTLTFKDRDPEKVMRVTNALASNFITENLKIRETQALGTSGFLADEVESIMRRLVEKEEQLKQYQSKHMGSLPDQLQTNLSIQARLQVQMEQLSANLRDAENRKLIVQGQIADEEKRREQISQFLTKQRPDTSKSPQSSLDSESRDVESLRKDLSVLESRYTASHPDVRRLRKTLADLETKKGPEGPKEVQTETEAHEAKPDIPDLPDTGKIQLKQMTFEIESIRNEIKNVQARIEVYQKRIEETPKRQQELLSLNRDYENLKELYNSMLNRKLEAEIAVSMEKKQKGEQFRVIDSAKIPIRPVEPDVRKIILMTLAFGLCFGGGLAYLVEMMDTSFRSPEDLEKELQMPILVSVPMRYTEREIYLRKRRKVVAAASVAVGFVFSTVGIVFAIKGVDKTLNYVKGIIAGF